VDFRSDNVSGAHPAVLEAIVAASRGATSSYGADPWSERVTARLGRVFEREVAVFPVTTGTAANALALATHVPPWGAVYCHREAHIHVDECGAPEQLTGGAKLIPLEGAHGKLDAGTLAASIGGRGIVHAVQPAAVSLSQATEAGTVYRPDEIAAIAEVARRHRLVVHMDGARFANALVTVGCTPAALTWQAGVDVLSLGATKNGCFAAEAVVLFAPDKAEELGFRRKRAGHLVSKQRLLSAQLEAYLTDDLWLANARHANATAQRLAAHFAAVGLTPLVPVEANEVFVSVPAPLAAQLRERGFSFYPWSALGPSACRFVTAFDTRPEDVEALGAALRHAQI